MIDRPLNPYRESPGHNRAVAAAIYALLKDIPHGGTYDKAVIYDIMAAAMANPPLMAKLNKRLTASVREQWGDVYAQTNLEIGDRTQAPPHDTHAPGGVQLGFAV